MFRGTSGELSEGFWVVLENPRYLKKILKKDCIFLDF
jgi:hypothetical protein